MIQRRTELFFSGDKVRGKMIMVIPKSLLSQTTIVLFQVKPDWKFENLTKWKSHTIAGTFVYQI